MGYDWIWKDQLQKKPMNKGWISMDMSWISFHFQERYPFISKTISFDIHIRYPWDILNLGYLGISRDISGYFRIYFWGELPDEERFAEWQCGMVPMSLIGSIGSFPRWFHWDDEENWILVVVNRRTDRFQPTWNAIISIMAIKRINRILDHHGMLIIA